MTLECGASESSLPCLGSTSSTIGLRFPAVTTLAFGQRASD
jgi:hypothetical protein